MRSIMIHQDPNTPFSTEAQTTRLHNDTLQHAHMLQHGNSSQVHNMEPFELLMGYLAPNQDASKIFVVVLMSFMILTLVVFTCIFGIRDCMERRRKVRAENLARRYRDVEAPLIPLATLYSQRVGGRTESPAISNLRSWRRAVRNGQHSRAIKDALEKSDTSSASSIPPPPVFYPGPY